jgi:hypothetical protein
MYEVQLYRSRFNDGLLTGFALGFLAATAILWGVL